MAYENGRQVNRYAAMRHHKDELKRRHTPKQFASYEDYVDYKIQQEVDLFNFFGDSFTAKNLTKRSENGVKEYYEKFWEAYSGFINPGYKKYMKAAVHTAERAFYRELIKEAMLHDFDDEEDNFDVICKDRFGDIYDYI